MQNRKSQNRSVLNAIRITMLDWDPMDLFMMGQAGLEEYDEYIEAIAKAMKKYSAFEEMEEFLTELAKNEMEVDPDQERTKIAAEKLLNFNLK